MTLLFMICYTQLLYKTATTSFVECFLFVSAQKNDAELFTFDKELKKLQ